MNFRTPDGKFLSSDQHGLVSANREARGPQEEWNPIILEDGMVALQNIYEKYLALDEVAGGALSLRADSDTIGFQEKFWVKVQHGHKRKAGEEERKRAGVQDGPLKIDEAASKCVPFWPTQSVVHGNLTSRIVFLPLVPLSSVESLSLGAQGEL